MIISKYYKYEIFLIIAGLSFGYIPIISTILKNHNVSTLEQVFIRALIGALFGIIVIVITFQFLNRSEILEAFSKENQFFYAIQGLILNIMFNLYFISIALGTPAGEAALLVQDQPLLTLFLSMVFLKEQFSNEKIFSLLIAFSGIFILLQPWQFGSFLNHFVGEFFALITGLAYSCYLIIGRLTRNYRLKISPLVSISFVLIWVLIDFIPILLIISLLPLNPIFTSFSFSIYNSMFILLMGVFLGLFGSVFPYGLIMIASRYVESSRSAILLLGQPLGAVIFGLLILSQPITIYYILGGGLLLFAIVYLISFGANKKTVDSFNS